MRDDAEIQKRMHSRALGMPSSKTQCGMVADGEISDSPVSSLSVLINMGTSLVD